MSYRQFLWRAEPYKTFKCDGCGALLKRSPMVWTLLGVYALVVAILALYIMSRVASPWAAAYSIVSFLLVTFLMNLLSWKCIGWKPVDQTKSLGGAKTNP